MEVVDKDGLHVEEFFREFLTKRITSKNGFISCAGRLHFARRFLQTQRIPFNLVLSVMERHQQLNCDDNRTIKSPQLISLFHDIFYAAEKLSLIADPFQWQSNPVTTTFDPDHQASLLNSFLASVFDPSTSRSITLLELKVSLLLLCGTNSIEELVQHHLNLLIDHNRCIHQTRFKLATGAILKMLHRLDDSVGSDSDTLNTVVGHSFAKVTGLAGLSDTQFYQFWNTENKKNPSEISFYFSLILFSRSLDNESVHEGFQCTSCSANSNKQAKEIKGIRFKCNRCSSVNLCTLCFLSDFQAGRHNPATHKFTLVQEPSKISGVHDGENGKSGNLMAKLLKVFYFMKTKRDTHSNSEEDHQSIDAEGVKTIRFLDETPTNNNPEAEKDQGKDKLLTVIEMLTMENRLFQQNLEQIQKTCRPDSNFHNYLEQHKNILTSQISQLQEIWKSSEREKFSPPQQQQQQKFHSTPFRRDHMTTINWDLPSLDASTVTVTNEERVPEASKQIRGVEIEKTFYEANRSDRSLQEISTWLHLRESFCKELISATGGLQGEKSLNESGMQSFRDLLHKVREVLEDTYSDNAELSSVTRQLEDALDDIIGKEEKKRLQTTIGKRNSNSIKQN